MSLDNAIMREFVDENATEIEKPTKEQEEFADEIRDIFQSIIDNEGLCETFYRYPTFHEHFNKHCLAGIKGRKSEVENIYYDFEKESSFSNYADRLIQSAKNPDVVISDLFNDHEIEYGFRQFFEGDCTLLLSPLCDLRGKNGAVKLLLHSYSTNVTTNYTLGNTIDVLVISYYPKMITLYPIDCSTLEDRLNAMLKKM